MQKLFYYLDLKLDTLGCHNKLNMVKQYYGYLPASQGNIE